MSTWGPFHPIVIRILIIQEKDSKFDNGSKEAKHKDAKGGPIFFLPQTLTQYHSPIMLAKYKCAMVCQKRGWIHLSKLST